KSSSAWMVRAPSTTRRNSSAGAISVTRRLRPTPRGSDRPKSSALIHGVFVRFMIIGHLPFCDPTGRTVCRQAARSRERRSLDGVQHRALSIAGVLRMLRWILLLLIIAAAASLLGFPMLAGAAATGARILIGIVLILFLLVIFGLIAVT